MSGTSATIGELIPASSYDVQVRATNAEGDGPWSTSQPGETAVLPVGDADPECIFDTRGPRDEHGDRDRVAGLA